VQFSQNGMKKRIHQSLESLLSSTALQASVVIPVSAEAEPLAAFNLEAFDLEALDDGNSPDSHAGLDSSAATMQRNFCKALLSKIVRNVGPAAYVMIEETALDIRIDLQATTAAQAARLTATMLEQVPISKRSAFQFRCSRLLEQFKR